MDDFSLTNSDCELSAREIPRTRTRRGGRWKGRRQEGRKKGQPRSQRHSAVLFFQSSFPQRDEREASRSPSCSANGRAHKLSSPIKTLLPAWLRPRLKAKDGSVNVERTEIENFQVPAKKPVPSLARSFVPSKVYTSRRLASGIVARGSTKSRGCRDRGAFSFSLSLSPFPFSLTPSV